MKALDDQFIRRVFRTSAWITALAAFACWVRLSGAVALGIIAGSALFLASLYAIERGVRQFIRPGAYNYRPLVLYGAALYPGLILALWLLVRSHIFNPIGIAAGVALPNAVIVLKIVGRWVNEQVALPPS